MVAARCTERPVAGGGPKRPPGGGSGDLGKAFAWHSNPSLTLRHSVPSRGAQSDPETLVPSSTEAGTLWASVRSE